MQSSTFLMNQFRLTATTTAAQAVLVTTSASLAVTAMTRARPSTATVHDDAVDAMNALGRIFNEQRVTLRNDNSDQKFKGLPANIYQGSVRSEANHLVSIFPYGQSPNWPSNDPSHRTVGLSRESSSTRYPGTHSSFQSDRQKGWRVKLGVQPSMRTGAPATTHQTHSDAADAINGLDQLLDGTRRCRGCSPN
ncbi:hypothetical protein HDK77DRAFT_279487 [Phyllosticta capitalensis]